MRYFSRRELVKIVGCDEGFVLTLEREEIVEHDAPPDAGGDYSERMLERVRVAHTLIQDLDVNLEGASIIVRMREEIADLHRELLRRLRS